MCRLPFIRASTSPARASSTASRGRLVAVGRRDDPVRAEVNPLGLRDRPDLVFGTDQHGVDQSAPGSLERAEQRVAVAGVDDGAGRPARSPRRPGRGVRSRRRGGAPPRGGATSAYATDWVGAATVAVPSATVSPRWFVHRQSKTTSGAFAALLDDLHRRRQLVAGRDHALEAQILAKDRHPGPRQPGPQGRRDDGLGPDGLGGPGVGSGTRRPLAREVERVDVARDQGQQLDVRLGEHAAKLGGRPDPDLIEGHVLDVLHE